MDVALDQRAVDEEQRARASRAELAARLERALPGDGLVEPLPGLWLRRTSAPSEQGYGASHPSFCVIAQGEKEILLGDERYGYDPEHYLVATAALPIASRITAASPERPFLNVILRLDPALVGSVMVEADHLAAQGRAATRAIDVSPLDARLLDATVRLVRLLEAPAEAHFLAPLITREIVYRLLTGAQGTRLDHLVALGGTARRIAAAVEWLRRDFDRPLQVEDLARELGMSVSSFNHHFKAVTALSPLQFQKQLRLQEARRLLVAEDLDAAGAGRRVGYADAAHFTREYKRLFGAPPLRHTAALRETAWETAGV